MGNYCNSIRELPIGCAKASFLDGSAFREKRWKRFIQGYRPYASVETGRLGLLTWLFATGLPWNRRHQRVAEFWLGSQSTAGRPSRGVQEHSSLGASEGDRHTNRHLRPDCLSDIVSQPFIVFGQRDEALFQIPKFASFGRQAGRFQQFRIFRRFGTILLGRGHEISPFPRGVNSGDAFFTGALVLIISR